MSPGCVSGPDGGPPPAYAGIAADRPTGSPAIERDALVAAWDMETMTADGRLRDFGSYGRHGTVSVSDPIDGLFGRALRFDDVEDRIALESDTAFDLEGPHSIAAWLRVDRPGLHQHVVACDDKWALWVTPADQFRMGDTKGGGWSTAEGSVRAGQWTSVVSVWRGTAGDPLTPETISLYVNGEVADASLHLRTDEARALGTWNPGELWPTDACYIGFESHQGVESHTTLPFVGAIDELLVFSRAWTADEVRAFAMKGGDR